MYCGRLVGDLTHRVTERTVGLGRVLDVAVLQDGERGDGRRRESDADANVRPVTVFHDEPNSIRACRLHTKRRRGTRPLGRRRCSEPDREQRHSDCDAQERADH